MKKVILAIGFGLLMIILLLVSMGVLGFGLFKNKIAIKQEQLTPIVNSKSDVVVKNNDLDKIINRDWKWVKTEMNNDVIVTPKKSNVFGISFKENNVLNGTTDCNGFFGKYEINEGKLLLNSLGSTKMFCDNSQEDEFMKYLGEVESCFVNEQNQLVFQLKFDTGSMIFE